MASLSQMRAWWQGPSSRSLKCGFLISKELR
jgi:hypothetical protein